MTRRRLGGCSKNSPHGDREAQSGRVDLVRVLQVIPGTEGRNEILESIVKSATGEVDLEFATLGDGDGEFAVFLREHGIPLHVLGSGLSLRLAVRLRAAARLSGADVVQAHGHVAGRLLALATVGWSGRPATAVARHHNLFHHIVRKRINVLVDRLIIRRVDLMVASSTSVGDTLISEGCAMERLAFATNGRDWDRQLDMDAVDAHRATRRAAHRLVAVGNLKLEKDYPTMLRAMARLVESGVDAELVIAGKGSPEACRDFDSLVAELGLDDRVKLADWVPDVLELMQSADALVHASLDEASPQAVYEAAGLQVPVVATWAGGIRDILGRHQELVVPGDDLELASQLADVLGDPDGSARRAERIAVDIRDRYSSARCGSSYLRTCRLAVAKRHGQRHAG